MADLFPSFGAGNLPGSHLINAGIFGSGGSPGVGDANLFSSSGGAGSNQFFPTNPAAAVVPGNAPAGGSPPGIVPPATGGAPPLQPPTYSKNPSAGVDLGPGGQQKLSGGNLALPTFDPAFTQQFYAWLQQMLGQGATPFNLSAKLPSGGTTAPGTLTAPLNPIDASLQKFYQTGEGGPMPGVLPMWNAARAAMEGPQGPIASEEARIRGQFAFGGNLASSPFAQAMTQFGEQTALNENALLTQATLQALPVMQSFGGELQAQDQASINNMMAEFIRTRPEYSPLLNMLFGGATSSPGVMGQKTGVGAAGGLLSGAGALASGVGDLISILKDTKKGP